MSLSVNLIRLIKEKKISQAEICRKTGVKKTTLNEIVTGKIDNPTLETLKNISSALDVSLSALVDENGDEHIIENLSIEDSYRKLIDKIKENSIDINIVNSMVDLIITQNNNRKKHHYI
jgi:transcriptional regulator with XRE-family HTH domain